jgi:hypothetical protein
VLTLSRNMTAVRSYIREYVDEGSWTVQDAYDYPNVQVQSAVASSNCTNFFLPSDEVGRIEVYTTACPASTMTRASFEGQIDASKLTYPSASNNNRLLFQAGERVRPEGNSDLHARVKLISASKVTLCTAEYTVTTGSCVYSDGGGTPPSCPAVPGASPAVSPTGGGGSSSIATAAVGSGPLFLVALALVGTVFYLAK